MSQSEKIAKSGQIIAESKEGEEGKKSAPCFATKIRVVGTFTEGTVTLREFDGVENCSGAPVLEGFPSVGLTSIISSAHIVDQLDLPLIGVMTSTHGFPPMGVINSGEPSHAVRVFGDHRIVVIVSEIKLGNEAKLISDVVKLIFDFATRHKCPSIFTIDGLPLESLDELEQMKVVGNVRMDQKEVRTPKNKDASASELRRNLRFLTTNQELGAKLKEWGNTNLTDAAITGITGWILAEAPFIPIDGPTVTCLLAPVSSLFPDAWGAVNVISLLSQLVPNASVNADVLTEKAATLETKIGKMMRSSKENNPNLQRAPSGMYM